MTSWMTVVLGAVGVLGLRVHRAVDGELHVGGAQLAPVVEAHALPDEERVVLAVGRVPALGQPRDHLAGAVDLDQPFLHVVEHDAGDGRGRVGGQVEPGRLGGDLDHQVAPGLRRRPALRRRPGRAAHEQERERGDRRARTATVIACLRMSYRSLPAEEVDRAAEPLLEAPRGAGSRSRAWPRRCRRACAARRRRGRASAGGATGRPSTPLDHAR